MFSLAALSAIEAKATTHAPVDDIVNLAGGGAFAAPLALPPVIEVPAVDAPRASWRSAAWLVGSGALVAVMVIGSALFVRSTRSVVPPPTAVTLPSPVATAVPEPAVTNGPTSSPPPEVTTLVVATVPTSLSSSAPSAPSAPRVVASTVETTPPRPQCCAGEDPTACAIRVAAGASCESRTSPPPPARAPSFDRAAALRALSIDVTSCARPEGPNGAGHAKITFDPNGSASSVVVDAPHGGTAVGACIQRRYRAAKIPAFDGAAIVVGKSFVLP